MNQKRIITILFIVGGLLINPKSLSFFGIEIEAWTQALQIYMWYASIMLFWIGITSFGLKIKWIQKSLSSILMALLIIGSVELASAISYKYLFGYWSYEQYENLNKYMFDRHPYLVGELKKGAEHHHGGLVYKHNKRGIRGPEINLEKDSTKIRVLTVGGSTTYGVGVNNNETWPYYLGNKLSESHEIINYGVPGYSSVENLIQTALHFSDLKPDVAVYYIGLNDLRNVNVKDLAEDYSDYHAPALYGALGLCNNENVPSLASIKMFLIMCQRAGLMDICPNQNITAVGVKHTGVDERALSLFERNLENIIALCEKQGVKPIFVPQVLLEEVLLTGNFNWWIPYVPTKQLDDMMRSFNERLLKVATQNNVPYVVAVTNEKWKKSDFVDLSHFTPEANMRMAELMAEALKEMETAPSDSSVSAVN